MIRFTKTIHEIKTSDDDEQLCSRTCDYCDYKIAEEEYYCRLFNVFLDEVEDHLERYFQCVLNQVGV